MAVGRPSILDVAREVGASHTAVSLALRGSSRISDERRRQITEAAERMGYHPKVAAQLLRSKQTGQVGLIVPTDPAGASDSSFLAPILTQFVIACETENVGYHIEFLKDRSEGEVARPHQFVGGLVDGAIVAGYFGDATRKWLTENDSHQKVVVVDEPGEHAVFSAADQGVYEAMQHIAAKGHRRVGYIGGPEHFTVYRLGALGFQNAVRDFRLDVRAFVRPTEQQLRNRAESMELSISLTRQALSGPDRPTAMLCQQIATARAVIHAAISMGLDVPGDLSVVSFGTSSDAEKGYPMLTMIQPDYEEIVARAVRMLRRRIGGDAVAEKAVYVRPKLVLRQTLSSPPEAK